MLLLAALLVPAATASAHVEIKPKRSPAGGDARLTFEVPNERADAATRRIVIQMPRGVTSVEPVAVRGWRFTPTVQGGRVRRATLVAPRGGGLTGEQRGRFRVLIGLPPREGATLTFKVLQVYDNGEIVRWLGPEGTSEPAPTLKLTAAREEPAAPETAAPEPTTETQPPQESSGDGDNDDGGGVPIWAGVGLILLAAVAGSALARRRNQRRMDGMSKRPYRENSPLAKDSGL